MSISQFSIAPLLLVATAIMPSACQSDSPVSQLQDAAPSDSQGPCEAHIVYLNREGGTYHRGEDSAQRNGLGILQASELILSPPGIEDADWTEITDCVHELLSPYNLTLVEDDPAVAGGMIPHSEILMVRKAVDLGHDEGLTDFYYQECMLVEDAITPVFLETKPDIRSNREVCEVIVASVGFMGGIEHSSDCTSLFNGTFGKSNACGDRSIADSDLPCGWQPGIAETCMCGGGTTMNPHEVLIDTYGAACLN